MGLLGQSPVSIYISYLFNHSNVVSLLIDATMWGIGTRQGGVGSGKVTRGTMARSRAIFKNLLKKAGVDLDSIVPSPIRKQPKGPIKTPNTATIDGKTCVYSCVIDGKTRCVGITNDVARRGSEHLRDKGIKIAEIRGLSNLSVADAKAVEQTLINYYGLGKNGGTLLNKINSISSVRNPTAYEKSLIRGKELLDSVNYQWTN